MQKLWLFIAIPVITLLLLLGIAYHTQANKNDASLREMAIYYSEVLYIAKMVEEGVPLGDLVERAENLLVPVSKDLPYEIHDSIKSKGIKKTLFNLNDDLYDEVRKIKNYRQKLLEDSYGECLSGVINRYYILEKIERGMPIQEIVERTDPALREAALALYDLSEMRDVEFVLGLIDYSFQLCVAGAMEEEGLF